MKDVADLKELLEQITGNTAQMQGQYSQGRRSATQDRVVAQGASARGKCTVGGDLGQSLRAVGQADAGEQPAGDGLRDILTYHGTEAVADESSDGHPVYGKMKST